MPVLKHFNWKTSARVLLWTAVGVLAVGTSLTLYRGFQARAAAPAPYTVLRTESVFDSTGALRGTNHYVQAVRSDGSRVWRGSTDHVQERKIYLASGEYVRVNDIAAKKSTFPNTPFPTPRDPKASCITEPEIGAGWMASGEDTVGGYRTVRVFKALNGGRTITIWYGLDVGCAILQQRFQHETGVTQQDLAAVVLGEPDAALFRLSNSLLEAPPSELFGCPDSGTNSCAPISEDVKQKMDRKYNSLRAQGPVR